MGEYGFLEARKMIWRDRIAVVHWKDIRKMRKEFLFPDYLIIQRTGKLFYLNPYFFQNGDEIVSLIKNHESDWYHEDDTS